MASTKYYCRRLFSPGEMRKQKVRAHCPRCRHQQLFIRATINHPLHLLMVLITGGLWLVSWMAVCIGNLMRPWRCEHCGWHKPEFGPTPISGIAGKAAKPALSPKFTRVSRPRPERHPAPLIISAEPSQARP